MAAGAPGDYRFVATIASTTLQIQRRPLALTPTPRFICETPAGQSEEALERIIYWPLRGILPQKLRFRRPLSAFSSSPCRSIS